MKIALLLVLVLAACGGSKAVAPPPPPPVKTTGTLFFQLVNCQAYATAEYVSDSVTLGTEAIGSISKGYTVPSGERSAKAVVRHGSELGTWTYNDRVTVPVNGNVTAHPSC